MSSRQTTEQKKEAHQNQDPRLSENMKKRDPGDKDEYAL